MHIIFESPDPEGAALRQVATERMRFALRRLSWLVPRARVRLSDVNGPRGGTDKQCQIELKTGAGRVVVSSLAGDWRSALDLAVQRSARVLVRSLQRQARPGRNPRPAGLPLAAF
ncbi:MAG: HPF/RaiA family ribosome-associated protein [Pseudomonadota bacterium]